MGDSKLLSIQKKPEASNQQNHHEKPKQTKSEPTVCDKSKSNSLVKSCTDKISDLCMMIVRKQKGGKQAAPIVVTLSRSQPNLIGLSGVSGS